MFSALTIAGLVLAPLTGCESITGNPAPSEVRIIDASPDAPGMDIYKGSSALAYNLELGTITSYVTLAPGSYGISSNTAGTHQHLVTGQGTFLNGNQYTVIVENYLNSLHQLVLKDQNVPAPPGQIDVRFVHAATRGGPLDLYLVPTGSGIANVKPIVTNIRFDGNSGYLNMPAGTYTLIALPAGTAPAAQAGSVYTGSSITYSSGAARTFVLIDLPSTTLPGVQVVAANDYDPAAAS